MTADSVDTDHLARLVASLEDLVPRAEQTVEKGRAEVQNMKDLLADVREKEQECQQLAEEMADIVNTKAREQVNQVVTRHIDNLGDSIRRLIEKSEYQLAKRFTDLFDELREMLKDSHDYGISVFTADGKLTSLTAALEDYKSKNSPPPDKG
jgi:type II secretory pathway component PulM